MLQANHTSDFNEKGLAWYYKLKPFLNKKYPPENVVLIDVDSGDYFVNRNTISAYESARKKYPNKLFFIAHVGQLSSFLKPLP